MFNSEIFIYDLKEQKNFEQGQNFSQFDCRKSLSFVNRELTLIQTIFNFFKIWKKGEASAEKLVFNLIYCCDVTLRMMCNATFEDLQGFKICVEEE